MYGGTTCPVCMGTEFRTVVGFRVCQTCGNQLEFQMEDVEYTQGYDNRRRVRLSQGATAAIQEEPLIPFTLQPSPTRRVGEGRKTWLGEAMTHLKRMQHVLYLQTQGVISSLKCGSSLNGIVLDVWTRLKLSDESVKELRSINNDGTETAAMAVKARFLLAAVKFAYSKDTTLSVIYLACLVAGEAVMPIDFVRGASNGDIVYRGVHIRRQGFRAKKKQTYQNLFPKEGKIVNGMLLIAERIGVKPPAPNVGLLVRRYLGELRLSLKLATYIHWLHTRIADEGKNYLDTRTPDLFTQGRAYLYIAGLIVVTLKLLYGLNGKSPTQDDDVPPVWQYSISGNAESWVSWSLSLPQAKENSPFIPPHAREMVQMLLHTTDMPHFLDGLGIPEKEPRQLEGIREKINRVNREHEDEASQERILRRFRNRQGRLGDGGEGVRAGLEPPGLGRDAVEGGAAQHGGNDQSARGGLHRDYQAVLVACSLTLGIDLNHLHSATQKIESWILKTHV